MGLYFLKRVVLSILIVMLAVTLLFCMIHMVPGDPARILLGPRATPELIASLSVRMGLDQPLPVQILKFFGNILRGDLGMDVITNRPVATIVFGQLPYTLWLIFSAIIFCYVDWHTFGLLLRIASQYLHRSIHGRDIGCLYYCAGICGCVVFALNIRSYLALVSGSRGG